MRAVGVWRHDGSKAQPGTNHAHGCACVHVRIARLCVQRGMKFREAKKHIEAHAAFLAVEEERDREDLFEDFMVEEERKAKDAKRAARKANMTVSAPT